MSSCVQYEINAGRLSRAVVPLCWPAPPVFPWSATQSLDIGGVETGETQTLCQAEGWPEEAEARPIHARLREVPDFRATSGRSGGH